MKLSIGISFLTLVLLSFSCKTSEEVTEEQEVVTETSVEETSDSEEVINQTDDSLFASISHGACYGTCATYKIFIYDNGKVILEGIRFLDMIGKYESSITPTEKQAFIDKAIEIGFMDLDERYEGYVSDFPSVTTSIKIDGVSKEVYRKHKYPEKIVTFEKLFDDLLESKEWTKMSEE